MNLDQFRNWAVSQGQVSNPVSRADWLYTGECVSLVQQYLNKVYGIPFQARGHAKDWISNGNVLSYFDRVGSPQAGDIGVTGAVAGNPYGHIFIYLSPSTILEQNGRVSRRVSTGAAYPGAAILRRKGQPAPQEVIMNTQTGGELYLTALHRPAENTQAASQWNGMQPRDALIRLRSEPEWQTIDTKVRLYDGVQAKVNELSARPTKDELQKVVDELKKAQTKVTELENTKSEDTVLLDQSGTWLTKLFNRLFKGGKQ